jgi:hypothetical protein
MKGANVMTVYCRTTEELQGAPALAILSALSASIDAFVSALDLAHPHLFSRDPREPLSERESTAVLLHMHLYTCQELLRLYDHLTFDVCDFSDSTDNEPDDDEPDDDIPF